MAHSITRRTDLVGLAQPVLDMLSSSLGETVHLGVMAQAHVRFIAVAESTAPVRVASRIGREFPAHCTSSGKALLVVLRRDELHALYPDERLMQQTARTIATRTKLEAQLARIRQIGYAVSRGETQDDGVAGLAVAVPNRAGILVALNASSPAYRMTPARLTQFGEALRGAAARLSRTLE